MFLVFNVGRGLDVCYYLEGGRENFKGWFFYLIGIYRFLNDFIEVYGFDFV